VESDAFLSVWHHFATVLRRTGVLEDSAVVMVVQDEFQIDLALLEDPNIEIYTWQHTVWT
jgi:hypothetical protein